MAVPVFLHEVEEIVVVNHSEDRYAVEETPSLIQTAEDCCIEELPGTDSSVVGGHKLRKAMLRLISTSTKENNFEMGGWKKNTGFRKFLNLFQRKKSKNQKETSSPNDEKKIQNEKHLKNFHKPFMKCLKVRKSEKKSKKLSMETDSEVKVDPHEMKEHYCFSVTPAAIDDESCNDILNVHTDNTDIASQNAFGNYSLSESSITRPLSQSDSFRDIHLLGHSLSFLEDSIDDTKIHVDVSKSVESDGCFFETDSNHQDDKSGETMVKEVVTCKQSASIVPKIKPCVRDSKAIQCTEDAENSTAMMPYTRTRKERKDTLNSIKNGNKDETVEIDKKPVFLKPSHTQPFDHVMSTEQDEALDRCDPGDTLESLNQAANIINNSYSEDKLMECHPEKTMVEKFPHDRLPINGNSEDFSFQKKKSELKLLIDTKLLCLMDNNRPSIDQVLATSSHCTYSVYPVTADYTQAAGQLQSTPLRKRYGGYQSKQMDPSDLRMVMCTAFLFGWISCLLELKKQHEIYKGNHKQMFKTLQLQSDKQSVEGNAEQQKRKTDRKPEIKVLEKCQLVKNEGIAEGDQNSSDVLSPLQVFITPVDQQSLTKSSKSIHTIHKINPTMDSRILDRHQTYRAKSHGSLNRHQTHLARSLGSLNRHHPRHTSSNEPLSSQKKGKKSMLRFHCKSHAIKSAFQLHAGKHLKSRRPARKMNSIENFVFRQNHKIGESNKEKVNFLHRIPDIRSQLDVFMLPFNHLPNSQSGAEVNGTNSTEHALGASAERLPNIDNSTFKEDMCVFEQISTGTVTESMKFEWARFKSFWSFPMSCPISPTLLAKYGFYYTGNEDKVCCFSCGVTHGNWQKGQSVYATHYQISRRCGFMRGEDVGNVPIHGPYSSLSQRGGGAEASQTAEESELRSLLETPNSITSLLLGRERDPGHPASSTLPNLRFETRNGSEVGSVQNHAERRNSLGVEGVSNPLTSNPSITNPSVNEAISRSPQTVSTPNQAPAGQQASSSPTPAVSQLGSGSANQQASASPTPAVSQLGSGSANQQASASPTPAVSQLGSGSANQQASASPTPAVSQLGSGSANQQTSASPTTPAVTPSGSGSANQQASASPPTPAVTQSGSGSANQQASATPHTSTLNPTATQAQNDDTANQQRPTNQQQPTTFAQRHYQQQQRHGQQPTPGRGGGAANNPASLGVNTAKPRYPNYAVLTIRSSTFNGFPNHLDQTPLQMAQAGFFYAGYGDYVRCFFCGGGLRNWEPGDDPWVEHARWFPRCAYVKQNKGQTFINMVLQRHRELILPNEYINTTATSSTSSTATTQTARIVDTQTNTRDTPVSGSSTSAASASSQQTGSSMSQQQTEPQPAVADEEMNAPAIQCIKEMGYSDNIIKTAIQQLRREQGRVQLSANQLLEIIFSLGEEDLPPQRPDQTQAGPHDNPAPQTVTKDTFPPGSVTPSSDIRTSESQAVPGPFDPRPPRRNQDGDSSRSYSEEELKSIQEENNQLREQMKCKICMDNIVCISFLPCGHLCCCAECAPAMVKCPICRQIIRGSVKTYLS